MAANGESRKDTNIKASPTWFLHVSLLQLISNWATHHRKSYRTMEMETTQSLWLWSQDQTNRPSQLMDNRPDSNTFWRLIQMGHSQFPDCQGTSSEAWEMWVDDAWLLVWLSLTNALFILGNYRSNWRRSADRVRPIDHNAWTVTERINRWGLSRWNNRLPHRRASWSNAIELSHKVQTLNEQNTSSEFDFVKMKHLINVTFKQRCKSVREESAPFKWNIIQDFTFLKPSVGDLSCWIIYSANRFMLLSEFFSFRL